MFLLKQAIKKYDRSNLYQSIVDLHKQCTHAYSDASSIVFPKNYTNFNKLVISGMGGSGLGARAIETVYANKLNLPITRVNEYNLPKWVDNKTLVICSSYSGTTEETVNTAKIAIKKNLKWMAITGGGKLLELAKKHQVPYYHINPKFNPSAQPRMAIGYSIVGQLVLCSKAKIITFTKKDLNSLVKTMKTVVKNNKKEVVYNNNQARQLAKLIEKKQVIYSGAEHLVGPMHTIKNQLNENAKHFAHRHDIPELNHHLMEGLKFPKFNKKSTLFFIANSKLYSKRNQQRVNITKDVISKNSLSTYLWEAKAENKLSQAFEVIQFGAFANFYLTMMHGLNPAPIPWVDYFKTKLGQPLGK